MAWRISYLVRELCFDQRGYMEYGHRIWFGARSSFEYCTLRGYTIESEEHWCISVSSYWITPPLMKFWTCLYCEEKGTANCPATSQLHQGTLKATHTPFLCKRNENVYRKFNDRAPCVIYHSQPFLLLQNVKCRTSLATDLLKK